MCFPRSLSVTGNNFDVPLTLCLHDHLHAEQSSFVPLCNTLISKVRRFLCVHWRFLNCVNGKSYGRSEIVCFVCAVSVFLHIVTLRPFTLYPQRIQRTHVDCISTSLLQSACLCVRICWYFVSCVNEVPIRKDVNTEAKAPVLKVEHFQLIGITQWDKKFLLSGDVGNIGFLTG